MSSESVALVTPVASDGVFAMAMAPHDRALVAVGYRSGVLCIIDVLQGAVRHRLDGHDQEVQCVVWRAPVAAEASGDATALLASSSRDRTIKVWRVSGADAPQLEQQLTLPKPKQASSYSQSKRLWLPIAWGDTSASSKPTHQTLRLWSGSFDGNLFVWEWVASPPTAATSASGAKLPTCKPVVIKNGHSRLLFNIVALGSEAMRAPIGAQPQLLTMSLDRDVRIWRESQQASSLVCRDTLSGLGGYVYSVAYNAEADVVAAGVGDQTIRLWRLSTTPSKRSSGAYDVELLWKGLQSKVTCVAWSPFERSVLAFGTDDGHVGVVDVASKKTLRFKTRHSSAVQTLQWRVASPAAVTTSAATEGGNSSASAFVEAMQALESAQASGQRLEDALEAQASSPSPPSLELRLWSQDAKATQVLESDPAKPDAPSRVLSQRACSAFAWSVRGDRVALGRDSGAVEIFASGAAAAADLTSLQLCHEHEQRVVSLAWSADGSALASASQDGKIVVVRIGDGDSASAQRSSVFAGHSSAVTRLQWRETMLASSSIDGTAQVWDTATGTRVSCFQHHVGRALAVDWIDAFTLVSGGDDQTIRVWDYRAQATAPLPRSAKASSAPATSHQRTSVAGATAAASGAPVASGDRPETAVNSVADSVSIAKKPATGNKAKRKVKTRVFHTEVPVAVDDAVRGCRGLLAARQSATSDGAAAIPSPLLPFAAQLVTEAHAYAQEQDWEHAAQVHLLQGNVADALRVVAKEGALTASWLALAPMAGMDVWRELTNVYAQQLEAQGDKRSAGTTV